MGILDIFKGLSGNSKGGGSIMDSVTDLIGGSSSGLGSLVQKFTKSGLGDIVESWVGTGTNKSVSADQITDVLGKGKIKKIAKKTGLGEKEASSKLSELLPQVIDKLTPSGKVDSKGFDLSSITDIFK